MTTEMHQARIQRPNVETLCDVLEDPVRRYGYTGYIVSWALVADTEGYLWVNGSAQVSDRPGGPVDTQITLGVDGIEVWQPRYAPILEPRTDVRSAVASGSVTWLPVVRYDKEPLQLEESSNYGLGHE
jgi:hypothetical protein